MTDVAKPAPAQDLSKEAVPPSQTPVQQVAEPVPKVVTVPSPAQQAQPVPVPAALPTNPTPPVQQTESALQAKIPETVDTPVAAPVQQTTAQ